MGLEIGTYISDLNPNNPVDATDTVSQGDDHLRLIKSTILNSFPNITGEMDKSHTQLNNAAIKNEANVFTQANTFNGAVTVNAAFTSRGLDDDATTRVLHLISSDNGLRFGNGSAAEFFNLLTQVDDGAIVFNGSSATGGGVNIQLFGPSHASTPNLIRFRSGTTQILTYDGSEWDSKSTPWVMTGQFKTTAAAIIERSFPTLEVRSTIATVDGSGGIVQWQNSAAAKVGSIGFNGSSQLQLSIDNQKTLGTIRMRCTDTTVLEASLAKIELRRFDVSVGIADQTRGNLTCLATGTGTSIGGQLTLTKCADYTAGGSTYSFRADALDLTLRLGSTELLRYDADLFGGLFTTQKGMILGGGLTVQGLASVYDTESNARAVGYNDMLLVETNSSYTLAAKHAGGFGYFNSGAQTITTEANTSTNFPVGTRHELVNSSSSNITINAGTGTVLQHFDGTGNPASDSTLTLAPGGWCVIHRYQAGNYLVTGSGLS